MADTKISALTDGVTANATDALPAARAGANVYVTPAYIDTYISATAKTLTNKTLTAPTINGGTHTAVTGLGIRSTGAAFDLTLESSEVLTAGRTLSLVVGDAARTLTIPATGTVALLATANAFTAAQTITADGSELSLSSSSASQQSGLTIKNQGTAEWYFLNRGDLTAGNANRLQIFDNSAGNGVYMLQAATSWTANSDERLKKNIRTLSVLDRLSGFRAVEFDWRATGKHDVGVIAQEVAQVFPEIVAEGSTDPDENIVENADNAWGVSYDKMGALALQGVKELLAEVEQLKAEVERLKQPRGTSAPVHE